MSESRLTLRLCAYWERLRNDAPVALWQRFNPAAVDDLWPNCIAYQVHRTQGHEIMYSYEHVGDSVRQAVGSDLTGQFFSRHLRYFPGARLGLRLDDAVKSAQILMDEGSFVSESHHAVKFRSCLLPFADAKGRISHVVLGLSWR